MSASKRDQGRVRRNPQLVLAAMTARKAMGINMPLVPPVAWSNVPARTKPPGTHRGVFVPRRTAISLLESALVIPLMRRATGTTHRTATRIR
jgi:hypothetical protein